MRGWVAGLKNTVPVASKDVYWNKWRKKIEGEGNKLVQLVCNIAVKMEETEQEELIGDAWELASESQHEV